MDLEIGIAVPSRDREPVPVGDEQFNDLGKRPIGGPAQVPAAG
jgi:hypothetical protein